jgi:hypothetical protein
VRKAEGLQRIDVVLENAGMLTEKFTMAEDNEHVASGLAKRYHY